MEGYFANLMRGNGFGSKSDGLQWSGLNDAVARWRENPDGLPSNLKLGWGWHSEVAIHVLRLALSGALDRHPRLKLVIGHMGEGLPAMLARCDQVFARDVGHLKRPLSKTILDHVFITTSGVFTLPPLEVALAVFGIDRVLFSIDYPYSSNRQGKEFLEALTMPGDDVEELAHRNADRLLKLK
jgi:predicted TIM-barrel fold metal-dependent hydrolase